MILKMAFYSNFPTHQEDSNGVLFVSESRVNIVEITVKHNNLLCYFFLCLMARIKRVLLLEWTLSENCI
jgi:hypothetical protein